MASIRPIEGAASALQRERMVERQLVRRGVRDARVLAAMREVPREAFLEPGMREFAYEDSPLPIPDGQTISQPYVVARMIEAARIGPGDRVLEVGTGSGYAAAVLARVAGEVCTIERHAPLAALARRRLETHGAAAVEVRAGDGTLGWPERAPFDAILVAAGGPEPPPALLDQLARGGRLVMPVGDADAQSLLRITRRGAGRYDEEDLGDVRFVPLIGAQGWSEEEAARPHARRRERQRLPRREPTAPRALAAQLRDASEPLPAIDDDAFAAAFDRFAGARVVLLGEASHGTREFHRARAAITRRLIERHGFGIVAVEADWPDAAAVDRTLRGRSVPAPEPPFRRFPTWMWRNTDVAEFLAWLRAWNADRAPERRAGFYGLDLYSLGASIEAVLAYLDRVDPAGAGVARERYGCLMPWSNDPAAYGRMVLDEAYRSCEADAVAMLRDLLARRLDYARRDGDRFFDAEQNARLVAEAERYYRTMYYGSRGTWNLRDTHMADTLGRLLERGGSRARAVVWAHNSHIGDARHTEMGQVRGELNLGQLCRERYGDAAVALVGFGTDCGTVAAAEVWDGPMRVMDVRHALDGSYERLSRDAGSERCLVDLRPHVHATLRERLAGPLLERFIGVIYRPDTERWSHYAEASLPRQFDAWVWFERTEAVVPLPAGARAGGEETYPFGL
jgi:protein-L-isoaspartate(D-aspartate) O-methyltransferase